MVQHCEQFVHIVTYVDYTLRCVPTRHENGDEFGNRNIGRSPMFEAAGRNGGSARGVSPALENFFQFRTS